MAILPLCIFACACIFGSKTDVISVRIGVVWDKADLYAKSIYENIIKAEGIALQSFDFDEAAIAEELVKTGDLECAYVINGGLGEKIERGEISGIIQLIKSPATLADAVVNEMVYSSVIKSFSAQITSNELAKNLGVDYNETMKVIEEKTIEYYNLDAKTNFVTASDSFKKGAEEFDLIQILAARVLHGVIAIFILTAIMFMLPKFIEEKRDGFAAKLGILGLCKYYFSFFLSLFVINMIFGIGAIFVAKAMYPAGIMATDIEIAALCAYTAVVCMLGVFIVNLLNKSDLIYAAFIFVLIINIFFGGVIFDLNEISRAMGDVSGCFASSMYISAVLNSGVSYIYGLAALFVVFLVAAFAAVIIRNSSGLKKLNIKRG